MVVFLFNNVNSFFCYTDKYNNVIKKSIENHNKKQINEITNRFYNKYYNDNNTRRLILGSSPARRGTAVTGIPFEDADQLQIITGVFIDSFYINKSSSNFLYDVIEIYGGREKFYSKFYMNFICPYRYS